MKADAVSVTDSVRSVNRHGVSCSANTCGKLRVHQFIAQQALRIPGSSDAELKEFGRRIGQATRWSWSHFLGGPGPMLAGVARAVKENSIRFAHELRSNTSGEIAVTTVLVAVHIETETRRARPLPPDVRERAEAIVKY